MVWLNGASSSSNPLSPLLIAWRCSVKEGVPVDKGWFKMPHNAVQMMMDAKVLCGFWWFLQIESKCKVAREKGMSFSVW